MPDRRHGKPLPPVGRLRELFEIKDGVLLRRAHARMQGKHRVRWAGKPTGYVAKNGFLQVCVDGQLFYGHRIIWKLTHGEDPPPRLEPDRKETYA